MRKPVTKMSNQHLINRIAFFERKLAERPGPSEAPEIYGEMEDRANEDLAQMIKGHISYMKRLLRVK